MQLTDAQQAILQAVVESHKQLTAKIRPMPGVTWSMERDVKLAMISLKKLTELGHNETDVLSLEAAHLLERWSPTNSEAKALVSRWAPPEPPALILTARAAEIMRVTLRERNEPVEILVKLPNGKSDPEKRTRVSEETVFWDDIEHAKWIEKKTRIIARRGRSRDLEVDLETHPDPAPGPEYILDMMTGETTTNVKEVPKNNKLFSVLGTAGTFPVEVSKKPLKGKS